MLNRLVDTGRKYVMEINIDKSQIKVNNRELKEFDYFKCLESVLTRDGYCTREIKLRVAIAKEAFNTKYDS